jgi:hypothetical protein
MLVETPSKNATSLPSPILVLWETICFKIAVQDITFILKKRNGARFIRSLGARWHQKCSLSIDGKNGFEVTGTRLSRRRRFSAKMLSIAQRIAGMKRLAQPIQQTMRSQHFIVPLTTLWGRIMIVAINTDHQFTPLLAERLQEFRVGYDSVLAKVGLGDQLVQVSVVGTIPKDLSQVLLGNCRDS